MAVTETPLDLIEGNDPDVVFTCKTRDNSTPPVETVVNLNLATVELYIKTNAGVSDTDPTTIKYSTATTPTKIAITDAANGKVTVYFTSADIGGAGTKYYHLDVIKNSRRQTYAFGPLRKRNV